MPLTAGYCHLFQITIKRLNSYQAEGKSEAEKLYLRLLLVTDYVCGMTDSYAKRLYQDMNGII